MGQDCQRSLGGVALAPGRAGEPPADLHSGERHVLVHLVQACEADELARGLHLDRPPPVASPVELGLEPRHGGIALFAGEQVAQVLSNLRIGIHRRPRFKVGFTPSAQDEAIGPQFSHAAQPTWALAPRQSLFPVTPPPEARIAPRGNEAPTGPANLCGHSTGFSYSPPPATTPAGAVRREEKLLCRLRNPRWTASVAIGQASRRPGR
ncbi:hypothetical protein SCOCK_100204 [Actinacidiphila cocklensis]|uniref:Uncharacterized protein n=1 Tax=Actinacidiphila cocklensis TaxID=887465 RepID=A0A9W4GNA6_9ACTN|nr:hypothetical protein SCOCK_100204 [Actinacidiphila cocklensis]